MRFTLETVVERLKPTEGKFVQGAFDETNLLVGIVAFVRETSLKTSHRGNVYGMFVAPEFRWKGLGNSLLIELIKKGKKLQWFGTNKFNVVSENETAKRLYNSLGFQVYGVEQNALKFNGQYFDEYLIVLNV